MTTDNRTVYGVIYLVINKINNKIYVGQTVGSFQDRYKGDIAKNTHNEHLRRSIEKYGIDNFYIVEEYKVAYSQEELDYLEDWYITVYDTMNPSMGYNKRGGGSRGKWSEESKQKMSENRKGRIITKEHRQKLSIAFSGENHPFYNKKLTDEHKRKIQYYQRNVRAKNVVMICKETDLPILVFETCKDTNLFFNKKNVHPSVCKVCKGKLKSAQGYKWMYKEDYQEQHPDFNIESIVTFNPEELTETVA